MDMKMFSDFAQDVHDFQEAFADGSGDPEDFAFRLQLIVEELGEMVKSYSKGDSIGEQNEWADLLFVVIGHGIARGYDIEAALGRVAMKNKAKIADKHLMRRGPSGKLLKPSDQEHLDV